MVSVQGTRSGGPAVDYTVNPAVGFPDATGPEGSSEPVAHVLPAWDCITGQAAATAVLAAERHRRITGEGQLVELALKDVALAMLGNLGILGEVMVNGVDRPKFGNALYGAFGQDFPTADGRRIMIVALTHRQWTGLLEVTGIGAEAAKLGRQLGLDLEPGGRPVPCAQGTRGPVCALVRGAAGRGVRRRVRPGGGDLVGVPLLCPGRRRGSRPVGRSSDVRPARAAGDRALPDARPAARLRRLRARAAATGAGAGRAHRRDPGRGARAGRNGDRPAPRRGRRRRTTPLNPVPSEGAGIALVVAGGQHCSRSWTP